MTEFNILRLSMVISVAGLCASGFIVVFWLKGSKRRIFVRKNAVCGRLMNEPAGLDGDLVEYLERIEKTFGGIAHTIHKERTILRDLIQKNRTAVAPQSSPSGKTRWAAEYLQGREKTGNEKSDFTRRYNLVKRLAASGLTADKISKRVKVPRGEIELILKYKSLCRNADIEKPKHVRAVS